MPPGLIGGHRPDLTPAQLIAGIPILAELLHSFGVYDLSQAQQDSLGKTVTFCFGLLGADAVVRVGRNLKDARVESAALSKSSEAPTGPIDPAQPNGEASQGTVAVAPAEESLDPEEISDIEHPDEGLEEDLYLEDDLDAREDPDLDDDLDAREDLDLDDELGPIGDADAPEGKEG